MRSFRYSFGCFDLAVSSFEQTLSLGRGSSFRSALVQHVLVRLQFLDALLASTAFDRPRAPVLLCAVTVRRCDQLVELLGDSPVDH